MGRSFLALYSVRFWARRTMSAATAPDRSMSHSVPGPGHPAFLGRSSGPPPRTPRAKARPDPVALPPHSGRGNVWHRLTPMPLAGGETTDLRQTSPRTTAPPFPPPLLQGSTRQLVWIGAQAGPPTRGYSHLPRSTCLMRPRLFGSPAVLAPLRTAVSSLSTAVSSLPTPPTVISYPPQPP